MRVNFIQANIERRCYIVRMATTQTLIARLVLGSFFMLSTGCITGLEFEGDSGVDNDAGVNPEGHQFSTGTVNQEVTITGSASSERDAATGPERNALPVYPTAHPRIYLTPNRA